MKCINASREKSLHKKSNILFGTPLQCDINNHTSRGIEHIFSGILTKPPKKKELIQLTKPPIKLTQQNVLSFPKLSESPFPSQYVLPPPTAKLGTRKPMIKLTLIPPLDSNRENYFAIPSLIQSRRNELNAGKILSIIRHKYGNSNVKIKKFQNHAINLKQPAAGFNSQLTNQRKTQTAC